MQTLLKQVWEQICHQDHYDTKLNKSYLHKTMADLRIKYISNLSPIITCNFFPIPLYTNDSFNHARFKHFYCNGCHYTSPLGSY